MKPESSQLNYLQVGETIECGSCHPDKFEHCTTIQGKYGVKCECICHKVSSWKKQAESPQEDWIDELDKCYGTIEQRKNIDYYDLLEFIRGLLTPKQDQEEIKHTRCNHSKDFNETCEGLEKSL